MRIAVTGSIATDHLMVFEGRFADSLVVEQLHRLALSFLVEELDIRRGGIGANISFGLGVLGERPLLVGAVGQDFAEYRSWLERHGVDCSGVRVSGLRHTARFICTTDRDQAQIASFYAGAMSEAREIELAPLIAAATGPGGPVELVVVSPNDPEAMQRHTEEARYRRIPFAADPSQQLAWSEGPLIRSLVDGAAYLFSNEYEAALISRKTGWDDGDVLARVGVRVVTHGADDVVVERAGADAVRVPVVPARSVADPTGVGDAFRAGFLAGVAWGLGLERSAQVGCLLATHALETVGPQEYRFEPRTALERFRSVYGDEAAAEVAAHLTVPVPT